MPMFQELTRKNLLYNNYVQLQRRFPSDFDYLPETYTPELMEQFKEKFKAYTFSKDNLWLIKPRNSSYGKRIRFLEKVSEVKDNEIVSRYISDPLLIQGKKFDLRFHVLVTGHNPLKIYLHSDGFAKVSTEDYDLSPSGLNNTFKHITNVYLNKKNGTKFNPKKNLLSLQKTKEILEATYSDFDFSRMIKEVKAIIIKSLISVHHLELDKEKEFTLSSDNLFDVYGFDILIDRQYKPWLMEVNISPSLTNESLTQDRKKMLHQLLHDVFNIIGMVPYSHVDGHALEGEDPFKDATEEAIQHTLCEFTRPRGGFELLFPLKENIAEYGKFFYKDTSFINRALWEKIKAMDLSDLTEKASNLTEKESDLTEKESNLTEKESDLTEKESDLTNKVSNLTEKAMDITEKESELTEKTMDITEKESELTEKAMDLTEKASDSTKVISTTSTTELDEKKKLSKENFIFSENSNKATSNDERRYEKNIKYNEKDYHDHPHPPLNVTRFNSQLLLSPSKYCQCHQRTVFLKYPEFIHDTTTEIIVNEGAREDGDENGNGDGNGDEEYTVKSFIKFPKKAPDCLVKSLQSNGVGIHKKFVGDENIFWVKFSNASIPMELNAYQKYNFMINYEELSRKDLLYKNYSAMRRKFPTEFNYLPETHYSRSVRQLKMRFKDYHVEKRNLWLLKPRNSSLGYGIRFLKGPEDIKSSDIITKYIDNPLLIHGKKFDLRIFVLVTGHDPLKIYLYEEFFSRLATENYDLDLEDLDNFYKHLTNTSINRFNEKLGSKDRFVMSYEETIAYIEEKYHLQFSEIWEDIKDIAVKSFISVNHLEVMGEKDYHLKSNSLFHLYGMDVMIDENSKSWLIEINKSPDLFINSAVQKRLKYKLIHDILNIVGMVPYSPRTGFPMEGECVYRDSQEEAVQESICEFTRPMGGFERIFPRKNNIEYYKQFFETPTPNNEALWEELQKIDLN